MRTAAILFSFLVIRSASADAQSEPSLADAGKHLKLGDRVFVSDGRGHETTGVFAKLSDSSLSVLVNGQVEEIPVAEIRQIDRRGDSLLNGFLIGAAIGAGLEVAVYASCDEAISDCLNPGGAAAVGAGVFGAVGALIDHFIKGRTPVFRVKQTAVGIHPSITVRERAVSASLVFSHR
jgi:hypothetical protein